MADALSSPDSDVLAVLRGMRALLADERRWCQRQFAVDAAGHAVMFNDATACRWCLFGAVDRVADQIGSRTGAERSAVWLGHEAITRLEDTLLLIGSRLGLGSYNDAYDHPAVLRLLDMAIVAGWDRAV